MKNVNFSPLYGMGFGFEIVENVEVELDSDLSVEHVDLLFIHLFFLKITIVF